MSRTGCLYLLKFRSTRSKWHMVNANELAFGSFRFAYYTYSITLYTYYRSRYISVDISKDVLIRLSDWGTLLEIPVNGIATDRQSILAIQKELRKVKYTCPDDIYLYIKACVKIIDDAVLF